MSHFTLAAVAAAVALLGAGSSVRAGDLGDGGYGQPRPYYSGQYDHQDNSYNRHADVDDDDDDDDYEDTAEGSADYEFEHYAERYIERGPVHRGSTKDDYVPAPRARGPIVRPHRAGCVAGWQVKKSLINDGWGQFRLKNFGQGVAVVRAKRVEDGRPFVLKIDGCTGEVLSSMPVDGRRWEGREQRRFSYRD